MSYEILTIPPFDKQLKRLAKKYPSLKSDFAKLLESLALEPKQGSSLGNNCYKIRFTITSKGKGKSGGARVITNFVITENTVFLISIYDKSEMENLTDKELKELLKFVPE
jgi:mRNA-degrading endonuclease RelE of RelBE toxin-antitoxin system